jgi:hypothetical protein
MGIAAILNAILSGLISGAASKAGSQAFGWLLSFIGLGNNDQFNQIENQLQTLESDMTQVEEQLTDITQELAEVLQQMNWDMLVTVVSPSIDDIESHYSTFQMLNQDDSTTAADLQQWALNNAATDLLTINNNILMGQGGINPNQPGLLQMYAMANAEASIRDPNYNRLAVGQGSPLDVYYSQIEQYFVYLTGVQLKGLTLLINAYNAANENDLAQGALQLFLKNLALQIQTYLASVEAFAVYYAPDEMLIDIFGKNVACDPLARAGLTVDNITGNTTFYARMWMGSGQNAVRPFYPFSSVGPTAFYTFASNPISQAAGNVPLLMEPPDGKGILPDTLPNGDYNIYTVFPSRENCQWAMFRFSWTNPPDGIYQIGTQEDLLGIVFIEGHPIVNTLIEPSDGRYYYNPITTFEFNSQTPANTQRAVYSGRTSLWLYENAGYAGSIGGSGIYNFGLGDFSVECWIYLPEAANSEVTLLSSKAAFGAGGDQEMPGASGFLLDLTPVSDYTYKITFTVDSGYGYYQVYTQPQNLGDGRWHFITGVRRNYLLEIYLDGQSLATTSVGNNDPDTISLSACWNLMFGCKNGNGDMGEWNSFDPVNLYAGLMNEVAVWNRALSPSEIQSHMTGGIFSDTSGLNGYWTFASGIVNDVTGQAPANFSHALALRRAPVFYPAYRGAAAMKSGAK